ncbi:hypothetical protein G6L26_007630 [Agrobacterium radiobacter]|nr:hypothetical protein [Agrobacterium tumefaciens]KWT88048.1 hypothetical protein ASB65_18625 [Agrobacterium tumefaciens str. B6]MQB28154.1 hypothetical protein [Agrobacterium tumefaciens]NTA05041.1 hypothetical protein [Agrobacterium tumefaciens]NTA91636.1 hypothetical protein [Agrobacterium tumefaciens]NTB12786.1 hypothetical protein [Agrobacterium tumefaciens]
MQSEEPVIIQSLEDHLAEYGHTTVGQDIAAAILVIRDLHQKAALSAAEPPVAYRHTLHMELGQTDVEVNTSAKHPFGRPGADYSPEYRITTEPLYAALSAQVQDMASGVMASIAEERKRQIAKGYDASHDDAHNTYEIIDSSWGAAARISVARSFRDQHNISGYKAALIQAAAQIVAEIERLDRAAAPAKQEG